MFVLDTNTLIYYLEGDKRVSGFIELQITNQERFMIPTVCIVEFLSYPKVSETDKENFLFLTRRLEILALDYNNALLASELRLKYKLRLVDSVVAAAAISQGGILLSRDKDFKKIREIVVMDL